MSSRHIKNPTRSTPAAQYILGAAIAAAVATLALPAQADIIFGSGQNVTLSGSGSTDPNWTVVAVPLDAAHAGGNLNANYSGEYSGPYTGYTSGSVPFSAYVPQTVPGVYYNQWGADGAQVPITVGGNNYYWISATTDTNAIGGLYDYNWIVAQTFNVTASGLYNFDFLGAGDNAMQFFVNGSVSTTAASNVGLNGYYTDAVHPTITGGTLIETSYLAGYADAFGYLTEYVGSANLTAGENTVYMVLHDTGGQTGAFINQSTFESAVPEPSSLSLLGLGTLAGILLRRRRAA